jgi:hypothetical protein
MKSIFLGLLIFMLSGGLLLPAVVKSFQLPDSYTLWAPFVMMILALLLQLDGVSQLKRQLKK